MKNFILLVSLVTVFQTTLGQKQKLGFNLSIGETYYHSMQSENNIKQEINGQKNTVDASISGKTAFKVTAIKDSLYEMNVTYQLLSITMKLPNGDMTFSSEKNDVNDIISNILGTIKDKPFVMSMTKTGKIVDVKNLDSIFGNLFDKFTQLSPDQKQQIKGQLMQAYGEKAFKGSFEMVTAIYPNDPVEKGNTWTTETKLESGMEANLLTTFEYKERADNYNLIIGNGKIETANKDAYIESDGMQLKYNLTGKMNSIIKVDRATGWIIESKINQNISGTAEIKDNPKLPGGLTIPMTIETEMIFHSK